MSGEMTSKLAFEDLSLTLRGRRILDNISGGFEPGKVTVILGENGAGKSTLMKIFSGFLRPDSGELRFDGKTVRIHSPDDAIRLGIGMLLAFAVGHSAVIMLMGVFAGALRKVLSWNERSRAAPVIRRVCGLLLIAGAGYMIYQSV